jgi:transposase
VHARSVVACGLDGQTGKLFERRLTPDRGEVAAWIEGLPGPAVVTYEAGPTGFGGCLGSGWRGCLTVLW